MVGIIVFIRQQWLSGRTNELNTCNSEQLKKLWQLVKNSRETLRYHMSGVAGKK
jgi:hypothetical protein